MTESGVGAIGFLRGTVQAAFWLVVAGFLAAVGFFENCAKPTLLFNLLFVGLALQFLDQGIGWASPVQRRFWTLGMLVLAAGFAAMIGFLALVAVDASYFALLLPGDGEVCLGPRSF